ncbi:MAG: MBL fold metallo-hydrolase [Rhizobium sp.]|nr:MBL fold metallo-hydrolase [Rhizobium sp.]MBX9456382.1 MBL fold metallo-hydrolase [Rhizobium sp.]
MLRWLLSIALFVATPLTVLAQDKQQPRHFSQCQAIAGRLPGVTFARYEPAPRLFQPAALSDEPVTITFLGHSTFHIATPDGVTIATDYSGWHKPPVPPLVATMNHAHTTHYTLTPEPEIKYVLHGWSDTPGESIKHEILVEDTFIRNVTTDINRWGRSEKDGNSIFIFEVQGLCIGHLGHLHHELDEGHYAEIGRLDVVMVPVDGGLTMGKESMSKVVQRLRSSVILPMHRRGPVIDDFLDMFGPEFDKVVSTEAVIQVSLRSLPKKPTIYVLRGV